MRLVAIREALFHSEIDHPQRHVAAHERIAAARAEVERVEAATSRRFVLTRLEDTTGVSGTGPVAEGVTFTDGTSVLRWTTARRSTAIYASMEELEAIHGHEGRTVVTWVD